VGGGAETHPARKARLAATAIAVIKEVGDLPEDIAPTFTLSLYRILIIPYFMAFEPIPSEKT
jgi:hypothetical protein